MAYRNNYEDLLKDIQASGQNWSSYDLELAKSNPDAGRSIYTQKQAYANAKTDAERKAANDAAEMIRRQYGGYTAGSSGSGFTLTGQASQNSAPAYTQYTSKYQSQIDDLMSQLTNRQPFSYNPTDDPSYAAYSEHYRNAGEQARKDTLAQAAAMVGGQPSTYAIAAAEQAQNAHNAAMSDIIPQLRDAAYSMYSNEATNLRNDLNALLALDEMEYARHQDAYANEMAKWQADYGVSRDILEDMRYENELKLANQNTTNKAAKKKADGGVELDEARVKQAVQLAKTIASRANFSGGTDSIFEALVAQGYSVGEVAEAMMTLGYSATAINGLLKRHDSDLEVA